MGKAFQSPWACHGTLPISPTPLTVIGVCFKHPENPRVRVSRKLEFDVGTESWGILGALTRNEDKTATSIGDFLPSIGFGGGAARQRYQTWNPDEAFGRPADPQLSWRCLQTQTRCHKESLSSDPHSATSQTVKRLPMKESSQDVNISFRFSGW